MGYFGAIIVGSIIGLIGGGGGILTVPILVYLFSVTAVQATSYSLFTISLTSAIGTIVNLKTDSVHIKPTLNFLLGSLITVFLTRRYLLPAIPDEMVSLGTFILTKQIFILALFSTLMISSSVSMIRSSTTTIETFTGNEKLSFQLFIIGLAVGVITGLVGAGGGFIIVPSLYFLAKMDMKNAVATSIFIMAINSAIGFISDYHLHEMDWHLLLVYSGLAVIGLLLGQLVRNKITNQKLKSIFGWIILCMGTFILIKELIL